MIMSLRHYLHHFPTLGKRVMVDPSSVIIGQVSIGDDCSIWPHVVIRGDVNPIFIGSRTNIQDSSVLHVTHRSDQEPDGFPLRIGNNVTIGHKVILHGCTLGNTILIGMGSIIMDNVIINDQVIVGAGSLVAQGKKLESGFLYLGSPAKKIRPLNEQELTMLSDSAQNYVTWKQDYLDQDSQYHPVLSSDC